MNISTFAKSLLAAIGEEVFFVLFSAAVVCVVVVWVAIASGKAKKQSQNSHYERNSPAKDGLTPQQREYLDSLRKRRAAVHESTNTESTHAHSGDTVISKADGHVHYGGSDEEHYDEIVGSLGEVDDEGCFDLSGVRLIAHDIAYESDKHGRDYTKVAQSIVIGDVLNNPRFKNPYRKK